MNGRDQGPVKTSRGNRKFEGYLKLNVVHYLDEIRAGRGKVSSSGENTPSDEFSVLVQFVPEAKMRER